MIRYIIVRLLSFVMWVFFAIVAIPSGIFILLTRWVKLNDLNFDIINWSVKDKFIDILH